LLPRFLEKLRFLATQELLDSIGQGNIFISISTQGNKIEKIIYEKNSKELKFNLDLKDGEVKIENISFKMKEKADMIINIGGNDLIFENKKYGSPPPQGIVPKNDSETLCEKIIDFFESNDERLIDRNVATCLLAGLVYSTQNFQNKKTKPVFLEKASYLMEKGADYPRIIQFLYKTKTLSEVKILSRVLSKISSDNEKNIAWCSLSKEDFAETGSSSRDLSFVIEALKSNFSTPETIVFLWEGKNEFAKGFLCSSEKILIQRISGNFPSVSKNNCVIFSVKSTDLKETENKILKLLTV